MISNTGMPRISRLATRTLQGQGPPAPTPPPDPPTPSIPLFLASQDQLDIRLMPTPENVNKTGRFTQADFQEWSKYLHTLWQSTPYIMAQQIVA
jgi:hypothetical protein